MRESNSRMRAVMWVVSLVLVTVLAVSLGGCAKPAPAPSPAPAKPAAPPATKAAASPAPAPKPTVSPAPKPTAAPAAPGQLIMRISHTGGPTPDNTKQVWAATMKKLVEERSKGRVKVEIFPGGQLQKDDETIVAVVDGSMTGGAPVSTWLVSWDPIFSFFDLPGTFKDTDHFHRWNESDKGGKELVKRLDRKGMIAYFTSAAPRTLMSKKPVTRFDELKGLKIGLTASDIHRDALKAVGATAVPLSTTDFYTSLQTGMIDGLLSTAALMFTRSWGEQVKFHTNNFVFGRFVIATVLSKAQLAKLPADISQIITGAQREAALAAERVDLGVYDELIAKAKEKMGVKDVLMDEKDLAKALDLIKPVVDKYSTAEGIPALVAEANRLR